MESSRLTCLRGKLAVLTNEPSTDQRGRPALLTKELSTGCRGKMPLTFVGGVPMCLTTQRTWQRKADYAFSEKGPEAAFLQSMQKRRPLICFMLFVGAVLVPALFLTLTTDTITDTDTIFITDTTSYN